MLSQAECHSALHGSVARVRTVGWIGNPTSLATLGLARRNAIPPYMASVGRVRTVGWIGNPTSLAALGLARWNAIPPYMESFVGRRLHTGKETNGDVR